MLGNLHTFEESHLASSKTTLMPHTVLWRAGPSPHSPTPSIASSTRSILEESSNKELGQEVSILARARSDDLSASRWQLLRQLRRHHVLKSPQHGGYYIWYFNVLVRLDLDQCRDICVLAFPKSFLLLQGIQGLPPRSLTWLVYASHKAWLLLVHDQQSIQVWQQGYLGPLEEVVTQNKIKIIQRNTKEVYHTFPIPHLNRHVLC